MPEALIIDACRTPRGIGKVGKGALADIHPQHLAATVLKALAERNDLNTAEVDDIIWGTSSQRGKQGDDLGRMAALDAGYDIKASGVTLDRFCGSGITAVNLAAAPDHVGHGRPRHRRRHRDDVLHRLAPPIPKPPPLHGRRQPAPARACIRNRTRASAPTPSPRWKASRARRLDELAVVSQQRADARHQGRPFRQERWCPSTTRTARWRSTTKNSRARRRRWKALPALKPVLRGHGRSSARREGHDLRRPDPPGLSGPQDQARPPRRQLVGRGRRRRGGAAGLAGIRQEARPEAARAASSPWPTWATARR